MGEVAEAAAGQTDQGAGSVPAQDACAPAGTATTSSEEGEMTDPRADDTEFGIAVDVIYHRARAGWLKWCHRALLFGAVMFGSAAATDVANAKLCAIVAAALAALDMAFDPGGTAALHTDCLRGLHRILVRLRKARFSAEAIDAADEDLMDLSVMEPAPYNLLRLLASHEAAIALGRMHPAKQPVPWTLRPLVNVFRFEGW